MQYNLKTIQQLRPLLIGFRKASGQTQAELASLLGIRQQSYAKLEANPESVSVERLVQVLRLLNIDLIFKEVVLAVQVNDMPGSPQNISNDSDNARPPNQVDTLASKSRKEGW